MALVLAMVGFVALAPSAPADATFGVDTVFPSGVMVGQTGVAGTMFVTNGSGSVALTVETLTLVPSCGQNSPVADCPAASADPGVFQVNNGTGESGTACAGVAFTVSVSDAATGQVTFSPPAGTSLVLAPGGLCKLDFTEDVLRAPKVDADPSQSGLQTSFLSGGTAIEPTGLQHSAAASGVTTVSLDQPSLFTVPQSGPPGGPITDSATLQSGASPTGTITFMLFGPGDSTCDLTPVSESTVTVNGNGSYTSNPFTPTSPGAYLWTAAYTGDSNNLPASSTCGQEFSEILATPTLSTAPMGTPVVGGSISDDATLSGGQAPTGTIRFQLLPVAGCGLEGTQAVFTSTATVSGDGTYNSGPYTPTATGSLTWLVTYPGDAHNSRASTRCGDETVTVGPASPSLTTTPSTPDGLGSSIFDTAHLTGGAVPTGTVQFQLFAPGDADCTGNPGFTADSTISGDGDYQSNSFTPASAGTYNWVATYSGDADNASVATSCGQEQVTITAPSPTIKTNASSEVTIGGSISDTAQLGNGQATGTITFFAYGPDDPGCSGTPAFTATVGLGTGSGGMATSGSFTATTAGTYLWVASYSGDDLNGPASTACGDPNESVTVSQAIPVVETAASGSVPVGATISDTATVVGGFNPTGTITFEVFGPTDPSCNGTPLQTSTVALSGGSATSDAFTTTGAGTYHYEASYNGDANNALVAFSTCGASGESVEVTPVNPSMTTNATSTAALGDSISDTAMLSGTFNGSGQITFEAFGPNPGSCGATPAFTSTVNVDGDGNYASQSFTPTSIGDYVWQATYSGDANNHPEVGGCFVEGEISVITGTLSITTSATPKVTIGDVISDTATIGGGDNPTGMVTFDAYGPGDPSCRQMPVFTSTAALGQGGQETSGDYSPTEAGTYRWVASYGGDPANGNATTTCGDPGESSQVDPAAATVSTQASPGTILGGTISDTATLAGGVSPTGTIVFDVFGPNDTTGCGTSPAFSSSVTVSGNGNYGSGPFSPTQPGTYVFVASYSGDTNNDQARTGCGDSGEIVTVSPASPKITTSATPSAALGDPISDTAALSGGVSPMGTIHFQLYGPNPGSCDTTPIYANDVTVDGNGDYNSGSFTPTLPGDYEWTAEYGGDGNNSSANTNCFDPGESSTVLAAPTITTQASAGVAVGGTISDTATLAGGDGPSGTVTFSAFGPNPDGCGGTPAFSSTSNVDGNGVYTSGSFTPVRPGTYLWLVGYGGDSHNAPATGSCDDPGERVTVSAAVPTLTTQASTAVAAGGTISDTATIGGGDAPTGTITFHAFGPDDATCATSPAFTATVTLAAGQSVYPSGPFTATATGTYRFVASYSGDGNNEAVTTTCNDPGESVTVAPATPTLATTASAPVTVGDAISDTATLGGGTDPTGTITFELFRPSDPTCAATPVATSTATVTGDGSYRSDPFTATAPGTYRFEASYSGDANNTPIGLSTCGAGGETVDVSPVTPTITTQASTPVTVGGTISDTASLQGGMAPTGTITFQAFVATADGCIPGPVFTSTVTVDGNGTYGSESFTPTAPDVYEFVASYSGDADNAAASTNCGDAGESVTVSAARPVITTAATTADLGGTISDTATLSGGDNPTGEITFDLYRVGDVECHSDPVFTSTVTVSGDGAYTSDPFTPTDPGTYQWVASYGGDHDNFSADTNCGDPGETSTVLAVPTIRTSASEPVDLGGSISDTATLEGGNDEQGTITFQVFGPAEVDCNAEALFTATVAVHGDGTYTSASYTPREPGTFFFVASYSGDSLNAPATTSCGDPNETVTVSPSNPTITTQVSPGVTLGGSISDTATLSGGTNPGGTITFGLYRPDDVECDTEPVFTAVVPVDGDGTYSSGEFTPLAAGSYRFVAIYSGDANNNSASSNCGDETVEVSRATPAVTTEASGPVLLGGTISDTATLAGGFRPSGTITFDVYGPGDPTCDADSPTFTNTVTIDGDGTYSSGNFTPTEAGTYDFVARYSGDHANAPAATNCGDDGETVIVTATSTSTTTSTTSTTTPPPTTSTTSMTSTTTPPPTTSTTSTTPPPTTAPPTTARTVAPTTLPRTTVPPTTLPPTTVPPTTTSSTTSSTTPSTTTTLPPPVVPILSLRLDRISTPPEGLAAAVGHGCLPGSPVTLNIGSMTIGTSVADAEGTFTAQLHLDVPVGRYTVTAHCGVTLVATIAVVLSSQASTPASTAALLLILFLLILALVGIQLGRG